jgi:DNA modification methylase
LNSPDIQILLGDCFEKIGEIRQSCGDSPLVIVTDPPFNVGYHYNEYKDNKDEKDYYSDLATLTAGIPTVMIHYPEALYKFSHEAGRIPDRVVSWVYNSNTPRQHRDIAYFGIVPNFEGLGEYKNPLDKRIAERIAAGKKAKGYDWVYCDQIKNVSEEKTGHPCQMPLSLMVYIVSTLPSDSIILDPFMGSGTTILAAKITGRKAIGIEMSEEYFKIAEGRIADDMPLFANAK